MNDKINRDWFDETNVPADSTSDNPNVTALAEIVAEIEDCGMSAEAREMAEALDAAGVLAPAILTAVELFIEDDGKIMNYGSFDALTASDFGTHHITLAHVVTKLISMHPVGDLP